MPRLKVFQATGGFHDHVVAAPSRPAALKAWGAKTDLFSMGVARQVTDPKIVKQALARPGEVISLGRSGDVEDERPVRKKSASNKRAAKPPSRAKLTAAEKRFERLQAKQSEELEKVDRELAALTRKCDQLEKGLAKERRSAEEKVEEAREAYRAALDDWSG